MSEPLQSGMTIGPYRVESELGRGGMGAVYAAVHAELGHAVALKVILPDDAGDEESRRRFRREAMAAARLRDEPGIVGVRDYGEDAGRLWFAMPLIRGRTLEFEIDAGDLSPARAAGLVARAARAVHRAHQQGVIHRDLKPANVLVDEAGEVWVNDFGLARFTAAGGDAALSKLTQTGFFVGTPSYMAPEQIRGTGLDARADVYGLGATLYDALTGRPPFDGETLAVTLTLVIRMDPAPPSKSNALVPPELDAVTARCLAKDPADRYATALELAEDLERFVAGEAISASQPGLLTSATRGARRNRAALVAAGAVLGGASLAGGFAWWLSEHTRDTESAITATAKERSAADEARALLEVWAELTRTTAAPIQTLQDRLFGVAVPDAEVDAALGEVQAATRAVAARHEGSALPDAWLGLALVYADRAADGIARIDGAMRRSDDPLCDVVLARAHCARFLSQLEPPGLTFSEEAAVRYDDTLSDEMRQDLASARKVLEQAQSHALWAALGPTTAAVRYERVLSTLLDREAQPEPEVLTPLQDEPLLADETALLEGFARFQAGDSQGAAAAWMRPAHRRWPGAMRHAVIAFLLAGRRRNRAVSERLEALDAAAAVLAAFDLGPMDETERCKHYGDVGLVHWIRAETLPAGDPRIETEFDAAERAFDTALDVQPGAVHPLSNGALVLQTRARRPGVRNAEAVAMLRRAIARLDLLAEQPTARAMDHVRAGTARIDLARRHRASGTDPRPTLRRAISDLDAGLKAGDYPDRGSLLTLKAAALHELGKAMADLGESPALVYAQAALVFNQRFKLGGAKRFARLEAANLANSMALATNDPAKREQYLLQAQTGAAAILKASPDDTEVLLLRGLIRHNLAELAITRRRDPMPLFRSAEEDYSRAIDAQRGHPRNWESRGKLRRRIGAVIAAGGGDGRPTLHEAIADYDAALALVPNAPSAIAGRASCRIALAEIESLAERDPIPAWDLAIEDAQAAMSLSPRDPIQHFVLGKALYDRAVEKQRRRVDPAPDLRLALAKFEDAGRLAPRDWRGPLLQGLCLDKLGRLDEAIVRFEAAAKLSPAQPMVQQALQQARAARERGK